MTVGDKNIEILIFTPGRGRGESHDRNNDINDVSIATSMSELGFITNNYCYIVHLKTKIQQLK